MCVCVCACQGLFWSRRISYRAELLVCFVGTRAHQPSFERLEISVNAGRSHRPSSIKDAIIMTIIEWQYWTGQRENLFVFCWASEFRQLWSSLAGAQAGFSSFHIPSQPRSQHIWPYQTHAGQKWKTDFRPPMTQIINALLWISRKTLTLYAWASILSDDKSAAPAVDVWRWRALFFTKAVRLKNRD